MSEDSTFAEPPKKTLAWLSWYSESVIGQLDLTPEERDFAIDKGGKIADFAMRGFWKKHESEGIRRITPAAACAYAMAFLEHWAKDCESEKA